MYIYTTANRSMQTEEILHERSNNEEICTPVCLTLMTNWTKNSSLQFGTNKC